MRIGFNLKYCSKFLKCCLGSKLTILTAYGFVRNKCVLFLAYLKETANSCVIYFPILSPWVIYTSICVYINGCIYTDFRNLNMFAKIVENIQDSKNYFRPCPSKLYLPAWRNWRGYSRSVKSWSTLRMPRDLPCFVINCQNPILNVLVIKRGSVFTSSGACSSCEFMIVIWGFMMLCENELYSVGSHRIRAMQHLYPDSCVVKVNM